MSRVPFYQFLEDAVRILEREFVVGYGAVCAQLGARRVAMSVDGERSRLAGNGRRLLVAVERGSAEYKADARVWFGRGALSDLLQGNTTLVQAAYDGRFDVKGTTNDVLAFHDAFCAFVSSAARCESFPALLDRFLEDR